MKSSLKKVRGSVRDKIARFSHRDNSKCDIEVLVYHYIDTKLSHNWGPWKFGLETSEFERQIKLLNQSRTIIPINQLISYINGGKGLPQNSTVITFDDGYSNFSESALPILEKHNVPATIYVPTRLMKKSGTPYEFRLATALSRSSSVNVEILENTVEGKLNSESDIIEAYHIIKNLLKELTPEVQDEIITELEGTPITTHTVMSEQKIQQLKRHSLITIGGHSHEHMPLNTLSNSKQRASISKCYNRLKEVLASPPRHFSFPYGSFNKSAARAVKEVGFKSAVTTQSRPISARDWRRPYTIPRIDAATESIVNDLV